MNDFDGLVYFFSINTVSELNKRVAVHLRLIDECFGGANTVFGIKKTVGFPRYQSANTYLIFDGLKNIIYFGIVNSIVFEN